MSDVGTLPRPRLTLRVGITGHRLNKLGTELQDEVRRGLVDVMAAIDRGMSRAAARQAHLPYNGDPPSIRLVSALAEGADRLAVEAAPDGWALSVVLPMAAAEYERDFAGEDDAPSASLASFRNLLSRAETVTELPIVGMPADVDGQDGRARQYAALGTFLVGQVDLLVAVWNGASANGPGGTATVVTEALDRNVAVLWIDPARPSEARILSGFVFPDIHQPVTEQLDEAALDARLEPILGVGGLDATASDASRGGSIAPPYLSDGWPRTLRLAVAYPLLRRAGRVGPSAGPAKEPALQGRLRAWDAFLEIVEAEGATTGRNDGRLADVRSALLPRSAWANALASHYGQLYRSTYVTIFLLAGLSVPVGLLYLFYDGSPDILGIKAAFVFAELLLIGTVVILVRRGTRLHWHRSWIETRELSELLRLARPLACIGALAGLSEVARQGSGGRAALPNWYARATIRELRPPDGCLDGGYLRRVLAATLATEIKEQRLYHADNARDLRALDRFLHRWEERCFGATLALLVAYLAFWGVDLVVSAAQAAGSSSATSWTAAVLSGAVKPLVTVLAAGLPALGAAFAGIRAQGDYTQRAERSSVTQAQLTAIEREMGAMVAAPTPPTLERTGEILMAATRIMLSDVQDWRQAYVRKALQLPA